MSRLQLIQDRLNSGTLAIYLVKGFDDKINKDVYAYIGMEKEEVKDFFKFIYKSPNIDNFDELGDVIVEGQGEISQEIKDYMENYFKAID